MSFSLQAAKTKRRQASRCVKQWNVQLTRLMQPIGPGGKGKSVTAADGAGLVPVIPSNTGNPIELGISNVRDVQRLRFRTWEE